MMKNRKIMKVTITLAVIGLVAGLLIINALAQGNGVGSQGNGKKGMQGNISSQQEVIQQQKGLQGNFSQPGRNSNAFGHGNQDGQGNLNNKMDCNCDCECSLDGNVLQEQLQEQKRNMLQSQEIQPLPKTQTPLQKGNMDGRQNQMGQMNQIAPEDCDYSVEISGQTLKNSTIKQIAAQWDIDAQQLLDNITKTFGLSGSYSTSSILNDLRQEYRFTPAQIKMIAEEMKGTL